MIDKLIKDNVDILDQKFNIRLDKLEAKIDGISRDLNEIKILLRGLK